MNFRRVIAWLKSLSWYTVVKFIVLGMLGTLAIAGVVAGGIDDAMTLQDRLVMGVIFLMFCFVLIYGVWRDWWVGYMSLLLMCAVVIVSGVQMAGLYHEYPRMIDICAILFFVMSLLGLIGAVVRAKRKPKKTWVGWCAYIILCIVLFMSMLAVLFFNDMDAIDEIRADCVQTMVDKGYPRQHARDYCFGVGDGCVEKLYRPDCVVGLHCCMDSIEEYKKWYYLEK